LLKELLIFKRYCAAKGILVNFGCDLAYVAISLPNDVLSALLIEIEDGFQVFVKSCVARTWKRSQNRPLYRNDPKDCLR
jgi:hypothetical protein